MKRRNWHQSATRLLSLISAIACVLALTTGLPLLAATNVGGIVNTDTTWTVAGSPYVFNVNVQLDYKVTLSIRRAKPTYGPFLRIAAWAGITGT